MYIKVWGLSWPAGLQWRLSTVAGPSHRGMSLAPALARRELRAELVRILQLQRSYFTLALQDLVAGPPCGQSRDVGFHECVMVGSVPASPGNPVMVGSVPASRGNPVMLKRREAADSEGDRARARGWDGRVREGGGCRGRQDVRTTRQRSPGW